MLPRFQWTQDTLHVVAPAKVNLFLHITGRRADGLHTLESLFAFTEVGDLLTIKPSSELSLVIKGQYGQALRPFPIEENLVYKAAKLLQNYGKLTKGAEIILEKNLPVAAGIGGGSSDAAAALLGLIEFWGVEIQGSEISEMAISLGADVPACLSFSPQWVTGVGEHCQDMPLDIAPYIVLVNPNVSVSTPQIFKSFKEQSIPFDAPILDPASALADLGDMTLNSLYSSAIENAPVIKDVIAALEETLGYSLVRMSGSGATCFALYSDQVSADKAVHMISRDHPDWWAMSDKLRT